MELVAKAAFFVLSLIGIVLTYRLWRQHWVDDTRNEIFELRDKVFFYAVDNGLLETPAYRVLRGRLNSFIRFAHRITLGRLIVLIVADKILDPNGDLDAPKYENALADLAEPHHAAFAKFDGDCKVLLVRQIVKSSLTMRTLIVVSAFIRWVRGDGDDSVPRRMASRVPVDRLEKDVWAQAA